MKATMTMLTISILFFITLLLIPIGLQIFLSTRKNKWLGLILPMILFIFSSMAMIGFLSYAGVTNNSLFFPYFILLNLPMIISLVIYFVCRKRLSKNEQLNRMNIQDLE